MSSTLVYCITGRKSLCITAVEAIYFVEEVEAIYVQSSVSRKLRRICVNESLVVIRVLGESLVLKEFPTRIPLVPLECS